MYMCLFFVSFCKYLIHCTLCTSRIYIVHDFTSRFAPKSVFAHAKGSSTNVTTKKDSSSNDDDDDNDYFDDDEDDTILSSIHVHTTDVPKYTLKSELKSGRNSASCRALIFDHTNDGKYLYTGGNGGSIACLDVEHASSYHTSDASLLWKKEDATPHGINVLHQLGEHSPAGPLLVSGDDEGVVRLWDARLCGYDNNANVDSSAGVATAKSKNPFKEVLPKGCIASFHENTDYITGLTTDTSCETLVATSADGTLSIIDLRKNSNTGKMTKKEQNQQRKEAELMQPKVKSGPFHLIKRSDDQEDELLSICTMKSGRKVICGSQNGVLNVWSWGTWGDISDRFPGHPNSIDALLKVDEDTLLTGSSDGVVRIVQIHPDRLLGVMGDHGGFPVEKLKFSAGRKAVGSVSHDTSIRLWDASIFNDEDIDHDGGEGDSSMVETDDAGASSSAFASSTAAKKSGGSDDEWEDMDDSDDSMDDSDDSDSDDDMDQGKKKPSKYKTENENFFSDL
jgi:hypothetical protein